MSERNVEVVRRIHEAWNRNESPIKLGLIAPDVEYVNSPEALEPGTRRGHEGWRKAVSSLFDSYASVQIDVERVLDLGDRVLVLGVFRTKGRESGMDLATAQGYLWTLRDGQAVRMEWFPDQKRALGAVGLDG